MSRMTAKLTIWLLMIVGFFPADGMAGPLEKGDGSAAAPVSRL